MTSNAKKAIAALDSMRLPELQARYLEVIGTATHCPNRAYLIRKISETLTPKEGKVSSSSSSRSPKPNPVQVSVRDNIGETHDSVVELIDNVEVADADVHPAHNAGVLPIGGAQEANSGEGTASIEMTSDGPRTGEVDTHVRGRYRKMTIEELQQKYLDVVGRPSSSRHVAYVELRNMWSCSSSRFDRPANIASGPHHILGTPRCECP